jgi:hypothetical protein
MASVIAISTNLILLSFFLKRSFKGQGKLFSVNQLSRIVIPSLVMAAILIGFQSILAFPEDLLALFFYLVVSVVIGCISYFAIATIIKAPEVTENILFKKLFRKAKTN